jgi:hypothetical protein
MKIKIMLKLPLIGVALLLFTSAVTATPATAPPKEAWEPLVESLLDQWYLIFAIYLCCLSASRFALRRFNRWPSYLP